jgi:hypothetical protein
VLGLEIDCGYHSRFKSPSGRIEFYQKLADTAGAGKPASPSEKLDDPHIRTRGRI